MYLKRRIEEILSENKIETKGFETVIVETKRVDMDDSFKYLNSMKYLNGLRRRSKIDLLGDERYTTVNNESNFIMLKQDPKKFGLSFTRLSIHVKNLKHFKP
jgi:hypothetical protein